MLEIKLELFCSLFVINIRVCLCGSAWPTGRGLRGEISDLLCTRVG